jgi:hypothetical protein
LKALNEKDEDTAQKWKDGYKATRERILKLRGN